MWVRGIGVIVVWLLSTGLMQMVPTSNEAAWISDILANPSRYWNMTVTITGQIRDVVANPPGTTRGTYTLFDDSSPNPLTVRSRDLPPVGREYAVTGVIIQDPAQAGVPLLDELERANPGLGATLRYVLIGGAVVFAGLLVTLVVMLARPRPAPAARTPAIGASVPAPNPAFTPAPEPATFDPTRKLGAPTSRDTRRAGEATGKDDRTKVFISLGFELSVEKGPDKGAVFPLHKPVTTLGRPGARKNDVELNDDTVSKEQASIFYDARTQRFTLTNQSATNPTTVDGKLATEPVQLEAGSSIHMGSTTIRFRKE